MRIVLQCVEDNQLKKVVWHIGGRRRRRERGGAFPLGLITSLAAPLLGEVAKPIFKTILGLEIHKEGEEGEER